jgi:tetratricopeptide (TPR) repeat protein
MRKPTKDSFINAAIAAAIVVATLAVYWQVHDFAFLNYDDVFVTENPYVSRGVTWDGIVAAFTKPQYGGWSPVATLTHMIDVDIFGLDPGPPHFINVIFHCSNTIVLFFLLFAMTRARWPSAFVAALFALHPLHVESVAWLSSRKDVLSMHFMLMTLRFYLHYVEKPTWKTSILVVVHFLAALLSKPMVVTLPVLLLLLDFWPLRRLAGTSPVLAEKRRAALRLVREKIPLFICSLVVSVITIVVQRAGGSVRMFDEYSWYERIGNALLLYFAYIWATLWPVNLAPHYPHPGALPIGIVFGAALLLLVVTSAAVLRMRRSPYLIAGWGWWLVSLLPALGLIQIGNFARADRFTYIPHIGLFIIVAWGLEELTRRVPQRKSMLVACAIILFAAMIAATSRQASHWRDSIILFEHALAVSPESPVVRNSMGSELMRRSGAPDAQPGDLESAEQHLREAVKLAPRYGDAHNNLGIALLLQGKRDEAAAQFQRALEIDPDDANALVNVANALLEQGDTGEAIVKYRRAIEVMPANVDARNNLGIALAQQGSLDEAVEEYRAAVALQPNDASLRASLANGLLRLGKIPEAATQALEGVKLDPENPYALYNLGVAQYTMRRTEEAIVSLRAAVDLEPDFLDAHLTLAEALADKGETEAATHHLQEMLRINPGDSRALEGLEFLQDSAVLPESADGGGGDISDEAS